MGLYNVYSTREFPLCLNCFFLPLLKYLVGIYIVKGRRKKLLFTDMSVVRKWWVLAYWTIGGFDALFSYKRSMRA